MIAETPGQGVRSQDYRDCLKEEAEVKSEFIFAEDRHEKGDPGAGQGGILGHFVHRHRPPVPVHVKPVRIRPLSLHLAARPNEERIVDVNRLVRERQETGQRNNYQDGFRIAPHPGARSGKSGWRILIHDASAATAASG